MSIIVGDGVLQYTFLEAIYHDQALFFIKRVNKDTFKVGYNCYVVGNLRYIIIKIINRVLT